MYLRVSRGKRRSLVVEVGRWRYRIVPGRFRWGLDRQRLGGKPVAWTLSGKFFLVTALRRNHAPKRA
jgi:hypothetical protein